MATTTHPNNPLPSQKRAYGQGKLEEGEGKNTKEEDENELMGYNEEQEGEEGGEEFIVFKN